MFAPTDEAFAKLPKATLDGLLDDILRLEEVLKCHLVSGNLSSRQAIQLKSTHNLYGEELLIQNKPDIRVNGAKLIKADIDCSNGVIHVIDTVLLPKMSMAA